MAKMEENATSGRETIIRDVEAKFPLDFTNADILEVPKSLLGSRT